MVLLLVVDVGVVCCFFWLVEVVLGLRLCLCGMFVMRVFCWVWGLCGCGFGYVV